VTSAQKNGLNDIWRERVERACIEEDDALYRRRGFPLWSLMGMMIFIVVFLYMSISLTGYDHLVKRASEDGWSMLLPVAPLLLFWTVRGSLLLAYLLLRWGDMSSVLLKRMVNSAAIAVAVAGAFFLIFFSQGPVPETTAPWVIWTLFTFPVVAILITWLPEALTYLSQRPDLADTPFFHALFVANSRQLLVLVDGQALMLFAPFNVWPQQIKVPLSTLRGVTIAKPPASPRGITLKFADGRREETHVLPYSPQIMERMTEFLRRKLPPSVEFTVDDEPPYFGRGGF
jgi:hypothetical protein